MKINGVLEGGLLEDSASCANPNEIGAITTGVASQSDVEPSAGNVRPMYVGNGASKNRVVYSNEVIPVVSRLSDAESDIFQIQSSIGTNLKASADVSFVEPTLSYDTIYANVNTTPTPIGTPLNGGYDISISAFPATSEFSFGNFLSYSDTIVVQGIDGGSLDVGATYNIRATMGLELVQAVANTTLSSTSEFAYTLQEPVGPGNFAFVETIVPKPQPLMITPAASMRVKVQNGSDLFCFRYVGNMVSRSIFAESIALGSVTKSAGGLTYNLSNGEQSSTLFISPPRFQFTSAGIIFNGTVATISRPLIVYHLYKV